MVTATPPRLWPDSTNRCASMIASMAESPMFLTAASPKRMVPMVLPGSTVSRSWASATVKSQRLSIASGGRMVIPVGDRKSQTLHKIVKTSAGVQDITLTGCVFVPLVGTYGWRLEEKDDRGDYYRSQ